MRALYFDCSAGISGDMTLGALIDLMNDSSLFFEELKKIDIDGFHIHMNRVEKNGISANSVDVIIEGGDGHDHGEHGHSHGDNEHSPKGHSHNHKNRNLFDVNDIIEKSGISENSRLLAKRIFERVAVAESRVHNKPLEEVHFHEVGALDSIIDIIGVAICIDILKPDVVYSSIINDGFGFTHCQHGQIPIPVPATAEIFSRSNAITRQIDVEMELVTPTGAAIIAEIAESYGVMPTMKIDKIGHGAGERSSKIPNILRVFMGETNTKHNEKITVIETNIDDCSSEILGYTMDLLFENGAKDVYYSPIYMKKNRPAYKMTVLCDDKDLEVLEKIIFRETSTIGIRKRTENRVCLDRDITTITTKYGDVEVKQTSAYGEIRKSPEFESAKKLAIKNDVPIRDIYNEIK